MKEAYLIRNLRGDYLYAHLGDEVIYTSKREKALTFDEEFTHEMLNYLRNRKQKVTFEPVFQPETKVMK